MSCEPCSLFGTTISSLNQRRLWFRPVKLLLRYSGSITCQFRCCFLSKSKRQQNYDGVGERK